MTVHLSYFVVCLFKICDLLVLLLFDLFLCLPVKKRKNHCHILQDSAKDGVGNSSTNHVIAIILVIVSVCVVAGFIAALLWCLKKKKKKNKASKEKSSNEIDLSEPIRMSFDDSTHSINANQTHSSHEGYMRSNSSVADNPNQTTHWPGGEVRLLPLLSTEHAPSRQRLNYSYIEKFPRNLTKADKACSTFNKCYEDQFERFLDH